MVSAAHVRDGLLYICGSRSRHQPPGAPHPSRLSTGSSLQYALAERLLCAWCRWPGLCSGGAGQGGPCSLSLLQGQSGQSWHVLAPLQGGEEMGLMREEGD